jgi:capsular exopolysaccharide synthesis family protein
MNNPNTFLQERQTKPSQHESGINPMMILSLIMSNWYYFVITLIAALLVARVYLSHTMPVYSVSTTILINEEQNNPSANNDQLLKGLGLPGGMIKMDNQIMVLSSRAITEKALNELPYEIEYYFKTLRNTIPIYPDIPFEIVSDNQIPLPSDVEFSVLNLGNNRFSLDSESESYMLHKLANFGDTIKIQEGSFRIELKNEDWFNKTKDKKLYFEIYSPNRLVNNFHRRLDVQLLSQEGSILRIVMAGTNRAKDVDFLNKLAQVFQKNSLDKKNIEAERRIQFIDDQLVGITDSLSLTETKLQQFRSSHRVMDLSAQGQDIISQLTRLENERARLSLEADYYDYLVDYLAKDVSGEAPIVPITMGITDPGLTRLVTELADLQGQLSSRGGGEMNPLQNLIVQRVRSAKESIRQTLNGLRRANSLAMSENQRQIIKVNSQASALPSTERQLLGIERKFKLNDELYTFLLKTRDEQQMQKASNMADSEVIDPASVYTSSIISPSPPKAYFVSLLAGFGIPFVIIFLRFLFNKKLKDEDIDRMTDIPVVGRIPHNSEKTNTVVFDYPNSTIAEAYRSLRIRMQFFTKEAKAPVVLVTSAMPGDGKTFTAINLASAYSLLGKKTMLVGFDLRKPKIFQDFNLDNDKGVSTWLIGKDKLEDIIKETSFENLSVISAGPIPPNPSELTSLDKTDELLRLLKERYDYIIIDSSPIGIVSDTFYLASLADSCLLVVRPKETLRDMLEKTIKEIKLSNMKGVSLVLNDIQSNSKHYGYGDKYGYTNDKKRLKKYFFKRKNKIAGNNLI